MLEALKKQVLMANLALVKNKIVVLTWGNVSAVSKNRKYVVIKPSGVPFEEMKADDMVVTDIDGHVVEGKKKPSIDLLTHLIIYKEFTAVNSIVHTHSVNAVAFAQAKCAIPVLGTTHADYFYGSIPCTRVLTKEEVAKDYELNTGKAIIEAFKTNDYIAVPGVLVAEHGPFIWGRDIKEAIQNAVALETIAAMAIKTKILNDTYDTIESYILGKHYERKHGKNAYYGQD